MPCNCDHLEPSMREIESKRVMNLLSEVVFMGDVGYYGDVAALDEHTAKLCEFCQNNNVTNHSLELQIWWRDHQESDRRKLKKAQQKAKTKEEKNKAIEKLTPYERKLLGL